MHLTWRDGVATTFAAGAALIYGLWAGGIAMTGTSPRIVALLILGLGMAGCSANRGGVAVTYGTDPKYRRPPMAYVVPVSILGAVTLVLGIWAVVAPSSVMLAALIVGVVALWLVTTIRHWVGDAPRETAAPRTLRPAA